MPYHVYLNPFSGQLGWRCLLGRMKSYLQQEMQRLHRHFEKSVFHPLINLAEQIPYHMRTFRNDQVRVLGVI